MSTLSTLTVALMDDKMAIPDNLNHHAGSLMHGLIMETLKPELANQWHQQNQVKPFTQSIYREKDGKIWWKVHALNEEAHQELLLPMRQKLETGLYLRHKKLNLIGEGAVVTEPISYRDLVRQHMQQETTKRSRALTFKTPSTFKSNGEYLLFPQVPHLYQSLVRRWECFSDQVSMLDREALNHLMENTHLNRYKLQSRQFHLENSRINGFIGTIHLGFSGPILMVQLGQILMTYSQYAGIGVKTALGMGGMMVDSFE